MAPRQDDPPLSALTKYAKGFQVKIKSKDDPEVVQSRLRREEADAALKRRIEYVFALAVIITVSVVAATCVWITLVPGYPASSLERFTVGLRTRSYKLDARASEWIGVARRNTLAGASGSYRLLAVVCATQLIGVLDWASKTLTVIISAGVGSGAGYLTGKAGKS